jgi:hypothetical protein
MFTTRFLKHSILHLNVNCSTEINNCILPAYMASYHFSCLFGRICLVQGDQKVSVHAMITIQKVTSKVQTVPRPSPDIY